VTGENPIMDVLMSPLTEDTTIDRLAEQLLCTIGQSRSQHPFTLDAANATDRQARRLFRPLLACLAMKSALETGSEGSVYGGSLSFTRPGPHGPVLILGEFDNRQANARITLQRHGPDAAARATDVPPQKDASASTSDPPAPGSSIAIAS
jgi:hypothetical protein